MSDTIPNIGSATTAPVSRGQGTPAVQAAPTAPQQPVSTTSSSSLPPWLEQQYSGNTELLDEARRVYSGELAYYFVPEAGQFGPALFVGGEGSERQMFLDPRDRRMAALELLYRAVCIHDDTNSQLDSTTLEDSLFTYLADFVDELKEMRNNLKEALEHPEHALNDDRPTLILQARELLSNLLRLLNIELEPGTDLGTFEGLKAALDKILECDQLKNLDNAEYNDQMLWLTSQILALKAGEPNAEEGEIYTLTLRINLLLRAIRDGEGANRLLVDWADFGGERILISLTRAEGLPIDGYVLASTDISGALPPFLGVLAGSLGFADYSAFIGYLDNPADRPVLLGRSYFEANLSIGGSTQEPTELPPAVTGAYLPTSEASTTSQAEDSRRFHAGDLAYYYTGDEETSGEGATVFALGVGEEGSEDIVYLNSKDKRLQALYNFFLTLEADEVSSENLKECLEEYLKSILESSSQEGQIRDLAARLGIDVWGLDLQAAIREIKQGLADVDIAKLIETAAHYLSREVNSEAEPIAQLFRLIRDGAGATKTVLTSYEFDARTLLELERQTVSGIEGLYIFSDGDLGHLDDDGHLVGEIPAFFTELIQQIAYTPETSLSEMLEELAEFGGVLDVDYYRNCVEFGRVPEPVRRSLELGSDPAVRETAYRFFTGDLQYRYITPYAGPEVVGMLETGEGSQLIALSADPTLAPLRLFYQAAFEDLSAQPVLEAGNFEDAVGTFVETQVDEFSALLDILTLLQAELDQETDAAKQEELRQKIQDLKFQKISLLQALADHFDLGALEPLGHPEDFENGIASIIVCLEAVSEDGRREVAEKMLAALTGMQKSTIGEILDLIANGKMKVGQRQFENGRIYELNRQALAGIEIGGYEVRSLVYSSRPMAEQLPAFLQIVGTALFGSSGVSYESFCEEVYLRANDGAIDAEFYRTFSGEGPEGQLRVYFNAHPAANDRERVTGSNRQDVRVYAGEELLIECVYEGENREPRITVYDDSDPRLAFLWQQLTAYAGGQTLRTYKERFAALYSFYIENQETLAGGRGEISEGAGTFEQSLAFNVYMRDFASLGNQAVEERLITMAREFAAGLKLEEKQLFFLILNLLSEGRVLAPGSQTEWVNVTADGRGLEYLTEADLYRIVEFVQEFHTGATVDANNDGEEDGMRFGTSTYYWRPDTYAAGFRLVDKVGQARPTASDYQTMNGLAELIHDALLPDPDIQAADDDVQLPRLQDTVHSSTELRIGLGMLQNVAGIAIYGAYMNPAVDDAHQHIVLAGLDQLLLSMETSQRQDLAVRHAFGVSMVQSLEIDPLLLDILLSQAESRSRLGPIAFEMALEYSTLVRDARSMGSEADAYSLLCAYTDRRTFTAQEAVTILNQPLDLRRLATAVQSRQVVEMPENLANLNLDVNKITSQYSISAEQPTEETDGTAPVTVPQTAGAQAYLAGVSDLTHDDLGKLANLWLYAFTLRPSAIPQEEWEAMAFYFGAQSADQVPAMLSGAFRRQFIQMLHRIPAFLTPTIIEGLCQLYRPRFFVVLNLNDLGAEKFQSILDNNWFSLTDAEKALVQKLLDQKINESAGEEGLLSKIISEEDKAGLVALLARLNGLLPANQGDGESARALRHAVAALELYLRQDNIAPIQQEFLSNTDLTALQGLVRVIRGGQCTIGDQRVQGIAGFSVPANIRFANDADRAAYEAGLRALKSLADRVARATFVEPAPEVQITGASTFLRSLWSQIERGYSSTIIPPIMVEQLLGGPEAGTIRTFKSMMYLDCIINPSDQTRQDQARGLQLLEQRQALWAEIERLRNELADIRYSSMGADSEESREKALDLNAAVYAYIQFVNQQFEPFMREIETRLPAADDGAQVGVRLLYLKFLSEGYRALAKVAELEKEREVERGVDALCVDLYGTTEVNVFQRAEATERYLAEHGQELDNRYDPIFEELNEKALAFDTDFTLLYQNLNSDTVDRLFVKTFDRLFGGWQAADGTRSDYGIFEWNFDPYLPQISGASFMTSIEGAGGREVRNGRELRDFILGLFEDDPNNPNDQTDQTRQWANLSSSKEDHSDEARARRALTYVLMIMPRENVEFNSLNAALSFVGNFAQHSFIGRYMTAGVGLLEAGVEEAGWSDEFSVEVGPAQGSQQSYLNNLREFVNNEGDVTNLPDPLSCVTDGRESEGCLGLFAEHSRAAYMAALMLRGYSVPDSRMRMSVSGIAGLFFGEQIDPTAPVDQQTIGLREVENALEAFQRLRRRVTESEEARDGYLTLAGENKVFTGLYSAEQTSFLVSPDDAEQVLHELIWYLRDRISREPNFRFRLYDDMNAATVLEEWGISQDDTRYGALAMGLLVLSRLVIDYSTLLSTIMPAERYSATGELDAASGYSPADTFRLYRVEGEGGVGTFVIERMTATGQKVTVSAPSVQRLRRETGGSFGHFMLEGIETTAAATAGLFRWYNTEEAEDAFGEAWLKGFEFGVTIPASIFAQFTQLIPKIKDLANLYVLSESAEDPWMRKLATQLYNAHLQQFWSMLGQTYGSFLAFELIPWVMLKEVEDLIANEQYGLAAGLASVAIPFAIQIFRKDMMFLNQVLRFATNQDMQRARRWNQYGMASYPLVFIQNRLHTMQRMYRWLGRRLSFITENPRMRAALERADLMRSGRIHIPGISLLLDALERGTGWLGRFQLPESRSIFLRGPRFMFEVVNAFLGCHWGGYRDLQRVMSRMHGRNPHGPGALLARGQRAVRIIGQFERAAREGIRQALIEAGYEGWRLEARVLAEYARFAARELFIHPFRIGEQIERTQIAALNEDILRAGAEAIGSDVENALRNTRFSSDMNADLLALYNDPVLGPRVRGLVRWLKAELQKLLLGTSEFGSVNAIMEQFNSYLETVYRGRLSEDILRQIKERVGEVVRGGIQTPGGSDATAFSRALAGTIEGIFVNQVGVQLGSQALERFRSAVEVYLRSGRNLADFNALKTALDQAIESEFGGRFNSQQLAAMKRIIQQTLIGSLRCGLTEDAQSRAMGDSDYQGAVRNRGRRRMRAAIRGADRRVMSDVTATAREAAYRSTRARYGGTETPAAETAAPSEPQRVAPVTPPAAANPETPRPEPRPAAPETPARPAPEAARPAEPAAAPAAPAEAPVIRWDNLVERLGVGGEVSRSVSNPHELAFNENHVEQVRQAIEALRRLGPEYLEGLRVVITEEGFRLVSDKVSASDITPWNESLRRVAVERTGGGLSGGPLSIGTTVDLLTRPTAPTPPRVIDGVELGRGVTLSDAELTELCRMLKEKGISYISFADGTELTANNLEEFKQKLEQISRSRSRQALIVLDSQGLMFQVERGEESAMLEDAAKRGVRELNAAIEEFFSRYDLSRHPELVREIMSDPRNREGLSQGGRMALSALSNILGILVDHLAWNGMDPRYRMLVSLPTIHAVNGLAEAAISSIFDNNSFVTELRQNLFSARAVTGLALGLPRITAFTGIWDGYLNALDIPQDTFLRHWSVGLGVSIFAEWAIQNGLTWLLSSRFVAAQTAPLQRYLAQAVERGLLTADEAALASEAATTGARTASWARYAARVARGLNLVTLFASCAFLSGGEISPESTPSLYDPATSYDYYASREAQARGIDYAEELIPEHYSRYLETDRFIWGYLSSVYLEEGGLDYFVRPRLEEALGYTMTSGEKTIYQWIMQGLSESSNPNVYLASFTQETDNQQELQRRLDALGYSENLWQDAAGFMEKVQAQMLKDQIAWLRRSFPLNYPDFEHGQVTGDLPETAEVLPYTPTTECGDRPGDCDGVPRYRVYDMHIASYFGDDGRLIDAEGLMSYLGRLNADEMQQIEELRDTAKLVDMIMAAHEETLEEHPEVRGDRLEFRSEYSFYWSQHISSEDEAFVGMVDRGIRRDNPLYARAIEMIYSSEDPEIEGYLTQRTIQLVLLALQAASENGQPTLSGGYTALDVDLGFVTADGQLRTDSRFFSYALAYLREHPEELAFRRQFLVSTGYVDETTGVMTVGSDNINWLDIDLGYVDAQGAWDASFGQVTAPVMMQNSPEAATPENLHQMHADLRTMLEGGMVTADRYYTNYEEALQIIRAGWEEQAASLSNEDRETIILTLRMLYVLHLDNGSTEACKLILDYLTTLGDTLGTDAVPLFIHNASYLGHLREFVPDLQIVLDPNACLSQDEEENRMMLLLKQLHVFAAVSEFNPLPYIGSMQHLTELMSKGSNRGLTLTISAFNPITRLAENYAITFVGGEIVVTKDGIAQALSREALSALLVHLFGDDLGSNALHEVLEWLLTQRNLRDRTVDLTGLMHSAILDSDGEITNLETLQEVMDSAVAFDADGSL